MNLPSAFSADYYASSARTAEDWRNSYRRRHGHYAALIRCLRGIAPDTKEIVDVGCGVGLFTYALAKDYPPDVHIVAGDISDYAIAVAGEQLKELTNVEVRGLNAQRLTVPSASVDLVVSLDVVEHLPEPEQFIAEAFRILRSGSLLFFSTPNTSSLGSRMKREVGTDGGRRDNWFALQDPTHIGLRPIGEWRALCESAGFLPVRDGTDFFWDVPYLRGVPDILQKLLFVGSHRLLAATFGFVSWELGENYYGIWRKP